MEPAEGRSSLALVFAGGDRPQRGAVADLAHADFVVAADSGVEHALALGWRVDLVVGDLDSADPAAIERATAAGAAVERYPTDKDATDLELALEAARHRGCHRVVVVGGHGGRLDHFLANALLLASPAFSSLRVEARVGSADVVVVRDHAVLPGRVGDLCSLLAVGGPALGVRTEGLRFPLDGDDLLPGSTRGVSNELVDAVASVSLGDGVLLAVLPFARADFP
jgi:thiamine pyrophosphokinase